MVNMFDTYFQWYKWFNRQASYNRFSPPDQLLIVKEALEYGPSAWSLDRLRWYISKYNPRQFIGIMDADNSFHNPQVLYLCLEQISSVAKQTITLDELNELWIASLLDLLRLLVRRGDHKQAAADSGILYDITDLFKYKQRSSLIVASLCGLTCNLATQKNNTKELRESGLIKLIIESLKIHICNCHVVIAAIGALGNVGVRDNENRLEISNGGGVDVIIAAMRQHYYIHKIQYEACRTLKCLASDDSIEAEIRQKGGVEAVLDSMELHKSNENVHISACGAFLNICYNEKNSPNERAVKIITLALQTFSDKLRVLGSVCGALWCLARHESNRELLIRQNAIELVMNNVKAWAKSSPKTDIPPLKMEETEHVETSKLYSQVVSNAFRALWYIVSESKLEFTKQFLESGAIQFLISLMQDDSPENSHARLAACTSLANFAALPEYHLTIVRNGGLKALLHCMKVDLKDPFFQRFGLQMISNCSLGEGMKHVTVSAGALEGIIVAMKTHISCPKVLEAACVALTNLGRSDDIEPMIGELGGIQCVVEAIMTHPNDISLHRVACLSLWYLSVHPKNELIMLQCGGLEAVVHCMKVHHLDEKVYTACCGALWNLAASSANHGRILELEPIQMLIEGLRTQTGFDGAQTALHTAYNLAFGLQGKVHLLVHGAVEAVVSVMMTFDKNPTILRLSRFFLDRISLEDPSEMATPLTNDVYKDICSGIKEIMELKTLNISVLNTLFSAYKMYSNILVGISYIRFLCNCARQLTTIGPCEIVVYVKALDFVVNMMQNAKTHRITVSIIALDLFYCLSNFGPICPCLTDICLSSILQIFKLRKSESPLMLYPKSMETIFKLLSNLSNNKYSIERIAQLDAIYNGFKLFYDPDCTYDSKKEILNLFKTTNLLQKDAYDLPLTLLEILLEAKIRNDFSSEIFTIIYCSNIAYIAKHADMIYGMTLEHYVLNDLIKILKIYEKNTNVIKCALKALADIGLIVHTFKYAEKVIPAVSVAIIKHSQLKDKEVNLWGAIALDRIMDDQYEEVPDLSIGVVAIANILEITTSKLVKKKALQALNTFASNNRYRTDITHQCVPLIINILKKTKEETKDVRAAACATLNTVLLDPMNALEFLKYNGVSEILNVKGSHTEEQACCVM